MNNEEFNQQKQNEDTATQDTGATQFENTADAIENAPTQEPQQENGGSALSSKAVVVAIAVVVMAAAAFYIFWF